MLLKTGNQERTADYGFTGLDPCAFRFGEKKQNQFPACVFQDFQVTNTVFHKYFWKYGLF